MCVYVRSIAGELVQKNRLVLDVSAHNKTCSTVEDDERSLKWMRDRYNNQTIIQGRHR